MATPNYAAEVGIRSLAAAIVLAVLYLPLFVFYFSKAVSRPIYVYIILSLFCAIRITAFVLRALLSRVASNVNVFVAYEILYGTGFFGLLFSAYSLIAARVAVSPNPPSGLISRLLRHQFIFRIALVAAVAIGITGAIQSSTGTTAHTIDTGNTLRKAAIYIFFACSILVLLQTFFLARSEFSDGGYRRPNHRFGSTYGVYILLVISVLLVAREAFFTATANNVSEQSKEAIWYPLAVVTEFLAVILFAVPGLVPDAEESTVVDPLAY